MNIKLTRHDAVVSPSASEPVVSAASEAADGQTRLGKDLPDDGVRGGQQRPGPEPDQRGAGGRHQRGRQPRRQTQVAGGRRR